MVNGCMARAQNLDPNGIVIKRLFAHLFDKFSLSVQLHVQLTHPVRAIAFSYDPVKKWQQIEFLL